MGAPHDGWSADFTGHCKTGDGRDGDPLPSTDGYRRLLLSGPALSSTRVAAAQPVFTRGFQACGVPCATNPLGRRSQLAAWGGRLGILPECIEPGQPPQNGRQERMHRTLNADTTRPPGATRRAHQRTCNPVRAAFTHERPHEALDRRPPAACDAPSPRTMPPTRPPLADPARFEVRDVSANGGIRWTPQGVNVAHVCVGADVGLEDIAEGIWHSDFGPRTLGRFRERPMRLEEA
jgi:hypothetical protein